MQFKPGDYALAYGSTWPENNMRVVRLVEYVGDAHPLLAVGAEWGNPKRLRAWVIEPLQGLMQDVDGCPYRALPWAERRLIPLDNPEDPSIRTVTRQRKQASIV